MNIMMPSS